jgi:peptidoglycan/LPS O-acetylase OafA/YrhL
MGLLRLFLAMSVLVTHLRYGRGIFGLSFLNGGLAVECFFIISGFYMALVLNEKYNYAGSYRAFLQQRFLRLYPLYLLVGLLILGGEGLASYFLGRPYGIYEVWANLHSVIRPLSACYYAVVNVALLGLDSLRYVFQDNVTGQLYLTQRPDTTQCLYYTVNAQAWTLAVEMTFYLVAPFLVRKSVAVQAAFLLASLALRSVLWLTIDPSVSSSWTYFFSPSDLFFFMAGSLGYHYYKKYRPRIEAFTAAYSWIFWVFAVLMLIEGRVPGNQYFFFLFVPLAIVMVPLLFAHTRNNKRDRFIGELSYPYYLIHLHVVIAIEAILHENHNALFGPLCAGISLFLAWLLYRFFELRTEHYREQLFRKIAMRRGQPAAAGVTPSAPDSPGSTPVQR